MKPKRMITTSCLIATCASYVMRSLTEVPAVGLLGPRQCGKSTLARAMTGSMDPDKVLYLDLERPADLAKLQDPEALLLAYADRLVCIDEIQRAPELFPVLRYLIDRSGRTQQFLVLGSASQDLLHQSSETREEFAFWSLPPSCRGSCQRERIFGHTGCAVAFREVGSRQIQSRASSGVSISCADFLRETFRL